MLSVSLSFVSALPQQLAIRTHVMNQRDISFHRHFETLLAPVANELCRS